MIKIIDKDFCLFEKFENFCKLDSFGTRIYSHFLCYGYKFSFADFWVQISNTNKILSALCRIDGDFIICVNDDSDFDEINSFLNFQDKVSLTFDYKYNDCIVACSDFSVTGDILLYKNCDEICDFYDVSVPDVKEYHDLLLTCKSEDFFVPDYMNFLSDVSRRISKNMCSIRGLYVNDTLVSCAMTVSQTPSSVILGAVATHPQHRKKGYGKCVVSFLANTFNNLNSVYIYTTIEKNTRFYMGIGFDVCGRWIKYTYGG